MISDVVTEIPGPGGEANTVDVLDQGRWLSFSYEDMLRYSGPSSPGGVAHAFKVMKRAFPALNCDGPLERREITVSTAFGGPGARDGFELVTRAVTGDRYVLDPELARPERGPTLEGFVTDEFLRLARKERSLQEDARLGLLKREMAARVMASPAASVYELTGGT